VAGGGSAEREEVIGVGGVEVRRGPGILWGGIIGVGRRGAAGEAVSRW
jgi:hypothetical protein